MIESLARQTLVGRNGELDDLQGLAISLASPASDNMTGHMIDLAGGWTENYYLLRLQSVQHRGCDALLLNSHHSLIDTAHLINQEPSQSLPRFGFYVFHDPTVTNRFHRFQDSPQDDRQGHALTGAMRPWEPISLHGCRTDHD